MLIGELPRRVNDAGSLLTMSLIVCGITSTLLGLFFVLFIPRLTTQFEPLTQPFGNIVIFVLGVTITGVVLVLDQAVVGVMRSGVQFWRNTLFAIAKLALIWGLGIWYANKFQLSIYTTWLLGNVISLVVLIGPLLQHRSRLSSFIPRFDTLRGLKGHVFSHYLLNSALRAPSLLLPIVVTVFLSAELNSAFYVAWMLVSMVLTVPIALTTVLYALGAAQPDDLTHEVKLTVRLSFLFCALAVVSMFVLANVVLRLFGASYASAGSASFRILLLSVFPNIIKVHYVAIGRIYRKLNQVTLSVAIIGLLEVALAAIGAVFGELNALSIGWVVGEYLGLIFTVRSLYRVLSRTPQKEPSGNEPSELDTRGILEQQ